MSQGNATPSLYSVTIGFINEGRLDFFTRDAHSPLENPHLFEIRSVWSGWENMKHLDLNFPPCTYVVAGNQIQSVVIRPIVLNTDHA